MGFLAVAGRRLRLAAALVDNYVEMVDYVNLQIAGRIRFCGLLGYVDCGVPGLWMI